MSQANVLLRYDGPGLADHKMDVRHLAPALMGFGNLCREANWVSRMAHAPIVRVLVNADINANCVTISFDVLQSYTTRQRAFFRMSTSPRPRRFFLSGSGLVGIPTGNWPFPVLETEGNKQVKQQTEITDAKDGNVISETLTAMGQCCRQRESAGIQTCE